MHESIHCATVIVAAPSCHLSIVLAELPRLFKRKEEERSKQQVCGDLGNFMNKACSLCGKPRYSLIEDLSNKACPVGP